MSAAPNPTADEPSQGPMHCIRFAEPGPPRPAEMPNGAPIWLITRHSDVRQVLTDPAFDRASLYAPDAPRITDTPNMLGDPDLILNQDGPDHRRLRRTVQRAFSQRAIARWRPWVASEVERLIDDLIDSGSPADAVASLSQPLPIAVISKLMGLEGLDRGRVRHWTDHALSDSARPQQEVAAAMGQFAAFAATLIAERRSAPGDDLVSSLLEAADGEGGIPESHLVTLVCALVVGGYETTMTVLGNSLVYLLDTPQEGHWERLGSDEGAAERAVEQLLRFIPLGDFSVLPGNMRRAVADVMVGGVLIPKGSVVAAHSTIANRDPSVFQPDGQLTDLFAPLGGPHMTFGAGPHYCLGAWLARMELQLALHRLAARLPNLRLAEPASTVVWRSGSPTRSPQRLTVTW
ncbi:cytochrome P450 [Streptomyces flaveolus]|uniref:cytochrome P450 n=1 Tax=Streptomyces flaveolus TaxID=67297 RepID=UPI0036FA54D3